MSRFLFVGCSHTMGYFLEDINDVYGWKSWHENNYAEKYAEQNNQQSVIVASVGTGNREFVNFLSYAFDKYDDISEVYIQSTYWGRFPLAINSSLNERDIYPRDFFMEQDHCDELIDRHSVGLCQTDKYGDPAVQNYFKPEAMDFEMIYQKPDISIAPELRNVGFMYTKLFHYLQTHLAQQDYFRDVLLCDTLCERNGAKMFLWNINDRCYIPKETQSFYSKLRVTTIADTDAERYILDNIDVDIKEHRIDGEHYNEYAHSLIAEHYIPHLRSL